MKKIELVAYVLITAIVILLPWVAMVMGVYFIFTNFSFWGCVSGVSCIVVGILYNYLFKPISNAYKASGKSNSYKWF